MRITGLRKLLVVLLLYIDRSGCTSSGFDLLVGFARLIITVFKLPNQVTRAALGDIRGFALFQFRDTVTSILPSLLEPSVIAIDLEVVDVLGMPVSDVKIA